MSQLHGKDILNIEKAIPIPIEKLFDFPKHPFKVINDDEMKRMAESIKEQGFLHPLIVRQRADGNYEIISGHRRRKASELAQIKELPCIIRKLTDDEAIIQMVDSNMQREKILPSEKAFAYKMKLDAQKSQGKRNDLTSAQVGQKLDNKTARDKVGEEVGESREQVRRYIRLTELIPEILQLVDNERIAFSPAVELSYLKEDEQYIILNIYEYNEATPTLSQAQYLKKLSQEGKLTTEKIEEIMQQQKPNQKESLKIKKEELKEVLPKYVTSDKQAIDFLIQCAKEHNQREEKRKEYSR